MIEDSSDEDDARRRDEEETSTEKSRQASSGTDDEEHVPVSKPPLKKRMQSQDFGSGEGGNQAIPKKSLPSASPSKVFGDSSHPDTNRRDAESAKVRMSIRPNSAFTRSSTDSLFLNACLGGRKAQEASICRPAFRGEPAEEVFL